MTTFNDQLTIIRRYLRDPDGNIWPDETIRTYWNDAQLEVATKIGFLEKVNVYTYPPQWTYSYMRDWEHEYTEGDRYRALTTWQARNTECCYPWEPGYWLTSSDTTDGGTRFTHPWESGYSGPGDVVPIPFHDRFTKMKFMAFDEQPLTFIDRKNLAQSDSHFKTASGSPLYYWPIDEYENTFVLYPRPSSITWDDDSLLESPLDSFDDAGGIITWTEAALDETDTGIITETVDADGNIFAIFESLPQDVPVSDWAETEIDWPEFLVKYIRFGALERCYGADTDGFIPSLRDFWKLRKEAGVKAMKRYKALRSTDRDYQLGGRMRQPVARHSRLPAGYPRQWP